MGDGSLELLSSDVVLLVSVDDGLHHGVLPFDLSSSHLVELCVRDGS